MDQDLIDKFQAQFNIELKHIGGGKYRCCCPYHAEQIPSFTIYPDDSYYCFGCLKSGFISDLLSGVEPNLQARLDRATTKQQGNIDLAFALAFLRIKNKKQVWDIMKQFDDTDNEQKKEEILEELMSFNNLEI